jgi:hypothetical protein
MRRDKRESRGAGEQQVPFDFAQGRLSLVLAALRAAAIGSGHKRKRSDSRRGSE